MKRSRTRTIPDPSTWGREVDDGIPWRELLRYERRLEADGRLEERSRDDDHALASRIYSVIESRAVRRHLPKADAADWEYDCHFLRVWTFELLLRAERLSVLPTWEATNTRAHRGCIAAARLLKRAGEIDLAAEANRRARAHDPLRDFPALKALVQRRGRRLGIGALDRWLCVMVAARFPTISKKACRAVAAELGRLGPLAARARDHENVRQNTRARSRR